MSLIDLINLDFTTNVDQTIVNHSNLTLDQCDEYLEKAWLTKCSLHDSKHSINNTIDSLTSKLCDFEDKLELRKKQLLEAKKKAPEVCKTIENLISRVDNPNQVIILNRIITDREYSKIYLSGYEPNPSMTGKKANLYGTVKVLGTYNEKKKSRDEYEIRIQKDDPKGMFWCSCADHKFNSTKKNIVCKHICFLICKIGKVLKPEVFQNKKLSDEDLQVLLNKLTSSGDIWEDKTIAKILDKITLDTFKQFIKAIDDCCPVCFNDLTDADKPCLLSCPTCKNYIHAECAEIWMEQKLTCAMCRSDFWKHYDKVKSGGSVTINL